MASANVTNDASNNGAKPTGDVRASTTVAAAPPVPAQRATTTIVGTTAAEAPATRPTHGAIAITDPERLAAIRAGVKSAQVDY